MVYKMVRLAATRSRSRIFWRNCWNLFCIRRFVEARRLCDEEGSNFFFHFHPQNIIPSRWLCQQFWVYSNILWRAVTFHISVHFMWFGCWWENLDSDRNNQTNQFTLFLQFADVSRNLEAKVFGAGVSLGHNHNDKSRYTTHRFLWQNW